MGVLVNFQSKEYSEIRERKVKFLLHRIFQMSRQKKINTHVSVRLTLETVEEDEAVLYCILFLFLTIL
jgi:hypothetical protein